MASYAACCAVEERRAAHRREEGGGGRRKEEGFVPISLGGHEESTFTVHGQGRQFRCHSLLVSALSSGIRNTWIIVYCEIRQSDSGFFCHFPCYKEGCSSSEGEKRF